MCYPVCGMMHIKMSLAANHGGLLNKTYCESSPSDSVINQGNY